MAMVHPGDMREDYEPFERAGFWWFWLPGDWMAGPYQTKDECAKFAERMATTADIDVRR